MRQPRTVKPKPNSPATGEPAITGTAEVGNTLGVNLSAVSDSDGMTGATYSYQWFRGNSPISDATDSTYTVIRADGGHNVKVRVSFTDDDGSDETVTSSPVSIPRPPLTAETRPHHRHAQQPQRLRHVHRPAELQ